MLGISRIKGLGLALLVAVVAFLLYSAAPTCSESVDEPVDPQNAGPAVERPDFLTCEIELEQVGERHIVVLRVHNQSDMQIPVPWWTLAEDGYMTWDLFRVESDGQRVRYNCGTIRRAPARQQDMIVLAPGKTFETRVDLSDCYDISQPGEYRIFYWPLLDPPDDDIANYFLPKSNYVTLHVE